MKSRIRIFRIFKAWSFQTHTVREQAWGLDTPRGGSLQLEVSWSGTWQRCNLRSLADYCTAWDEDHDAERRRSSIDNGSRWWTHALLICSLVTNFLFHQPSSIIRRITLCNISCRRPFFCSVLLDHEVTRSDAVRHNLKVRKAVYGLKDASFALTAEHLQRSSDVGVSLSQTHPRMFVCRRGESLEGILGVHVDDDLMTGSDRFEQHMIPALKKRFVCGTLTTGTLPTVVENAPVERTEQWSSLKTKLFAVCRRSSWRKNSERRLNVAEISLLRKLFGWLERLNR